MKINNLQQTKKYHTNGEQKKLIRAIPSQNDVYTWGWSIHVLFLELGEGYMDWAHLVNTYGAVHYDKCILYIFILSFFFKNHL